MSIHQRLRRALIPALPWLFAAVLLSLASACTDTPSEPPPAVRNEPRRDWRIHELTRTQLIERGGGTRAGGIVDESYDFRRHFRTIEGDSVASGHVHSSATGATYWVLAEGPVSEARDSTVGSQVELLQRQSFRKTARDATLTLWITGLRLRILNDQGIGNYTDACRQDINACDVNIQSRVDFQVFAFTDTASVYRNHSQLTLENLAGGKMFWWVDHFAGRGIWNSGQFTRSFDAGVPAVREATLELPDDLVVVVPLDSVALGEEFTLAVRAQASTFDVLKGESYVSAWFRDPVNPQGGTLQFAGLEPTNDPLPLPAANTMGEAPACAGGPDGGVLQFAPGGFRVRELPVAGPRTITVLRTGSGTGRVSARVRATGGTATPGADYAALDAVVAWEDGDTLPRAVTFPVVLDTLVEEDETVVLALADPRGCATLGGASAELTIADDDRRPAPPPTYAIGGTVTGLAGSGLRLENVVTGESLAPANGTFAFGTREDSGTRYDVRVATQPENPSQACTVANGTGTVGSADVTDIVVTCATPSTPSGLDPTFGTGGKLFDAELPGARAVVVQGSGRIVVLAGMSLVAYDASGARDARFGTAGVVPVSFQGGGGEEAYGLALQPDGKLLVTGRARAAVNLPFRMAVRRFDADGTPDAGFGTGGLATIDPYASLGADSRNHYAYRALVAPDGRILVAGVATLLSSTTELRTNTAVVRLLADGRLDPSFAGTGSNTMDLGGDDWAEALALQSDGKVVTGGRAIGAGVNIVVGLARFRADGQLDTGSPRLPEHYGRDGSGFSTFDPGGVGAGGVQDMLMGSGDAPLLVVPMPKPHATLPSAVQFGLVQASSDGDPVTVRTLSLGPDSDVPRALARQADGRLLVVGSASSATVTDFGIVRYGADLTLDTSFGTNGMLKVDFYGALDAAAAVAVQPDGRIVVAGVARNGSSNRLALVRVVQ